MFFNASSERFKKYRLRLCIRYVPMPITVKPAQGILKSRAGRKGISRKRKNTVDNKNAVRKVNIISERKAVFFMTIFLTDFLCFNLEKKENILYND